MLPPPADAAAARPLPASRTMAIKGALASIRRVLLDRALDEGLRIASHALAGALAPALVQVWLADQAPWIGELAHPGGQELFPALRVRAMAGPDADPAGGMRTQQTLWPLGIAGLHPQRQPDALVEDVAVTRRPLVLLEAGEHPLAQSWLASIGTELNPLGTLAAYPLQVRGQLLGVLAVGTAQQLDAESLAALEAVADYCAVAAEHDRLLSYSRGQEALAQTVVRHAPVAVAVFSGPAHVVALANPAFAQLLGVEGALRGRRLAEVVPLAAERLRDGLRLDVVYSGGQPQALVELPIHLDRGLTYWNVTSSPLPGRTAQVEGVLVAAVDVTRQVLARQRAVEAAEVAQERIGQMMALHATSLAVASQLGTDPRDLLADILRRSIALLNARAGAVYVADRRKAELEVILSHGLRGNYVGQRMRIGTGLAGQVARTGQGLVVDDIRLYPDTPVIYADEDVSAVIVVPLIHHGDVVGVLDVLDDADRRTFDQDDLWLLELFAAQAAQAIENARIYVELEHALRAQRELDRMKDDFIATASHELRTPLTGVQGFLELLSDYPGSRDEPLAREFLTRAAESAEELAELTQRLLQTSRLETGRVEVYAESVRLKPLVDAVLRAQAATLAAQGGTHGTHGTHALIAEVADDIRVAADPNRLKEVLENLVGNAIKYSPQGGTIRVSCVVEPAATPQPPASTAVADPGFAVVLVSDQGMGVPPGQRDRLFGRFSRLDNARSSQIRGTGLGLYICRQLMEAMGGSIWLHESAPGKGSTFALGLPLATPAT
jgi:signal transduction histidine kinase